ncbi:hypothetical protein Q3C01_03010 [Bradyrhizobium sp. UFLA05-109]
MYFPVLGELGRIDDERLLRSEFTIGLSTFMLQSNQVLTFFRAYERGDWSQPELAEFYRVEAALTKSGVGISTDRGLTDEGEPWFVFFRQDNEEVIVHFARIGGEYVVASNFTEAVLRGRNFERLVRELLDSHPYVLPKQHSSRSTVFLHPATLLAALVVTGYVKSSELNATADDGSRPEKSFGWFLDRHDLAATYSAIVIASVWDSLALGGSVSKPSDDLVSLDHAQPAHGEHCPHIGQAVADDNLLQNFQAFHVTDDRSVLAAAALHLDGQDAVHHFNEPAIAGLVAKPSGPPPESSHHDSVAACSAHDVVRAEHDLDLKLADFHPQQGDGFPIAAGEQVERTVTQNPVSSSAPSNLPPDHPAPEHVSTASTTAVAHADTTTTVPLIPNVISQADATQTPVSDLQPEVTSTVGPSAQVNQPTATVDSSAQVNQLTATVDPTAQVNQLTASVDPTAQVNQLSASADPTAQVNQLTASVDPTTQLNQLAASVDPAAQVNQLTATADPTAQVSQVAATADPTAQVSQVAATCDPNAQVSQVAATGSPTAQVNYAANDVSANTHDLDVSDGSTVSIVGIDVHHTSTALA